MMSFSLAWARMSQVWASEAGVRYTATLIKLSDDERLRNLSVEITLPASAFLVSSLKPPRIEYHIMRVGRGQQRTLIWQDSRIDAENLGAVVSFATSEPLRDTLKFHAHWLDTEGRVVEVNFAEIPPVVQARSSTARLDESASDWTSLADTGLVVRGSRAPLNLSILSNDLNPPPAYGNTWWCSLLAIEGDVREGVEVVVPLRRPLPPFSPLALFQQRPDTSWVALDEVGMVTADGQFASYIHRGGLMAAGVEAEQQPDILPVDAIPVEAVTYTEAPPVEDIPYTTEAAPPASATAAATPSSSAK